MQFELTKAFIEELQEIVINTDEQLLLERISDLHAADIAEILDEVNLEEAQFIYQALDEDKGSSVLMELDEDVREKFLASFSSQEIAEQVIENLETDDAADLIQELSDAQREEVLAAIEDEEQASDIADLLTYPEGTAGALMAKELIKVNENWTVMTCAKEMRKQAEMLEKVYTVYVVDDKNHLLGRLSLKKMLLTPAKTKVGDIYKSEIKSVKITDKEEDIAQMMQKYDLVVVPVVDELNRLMGRITIDDVVDVIKEEAEKDYQMASGISESVESTDRVWVLTRARLPWLLIGLVGGILGAQVIEKFEPELQVNPKLAFFIPLIAAMGGNVGVQSSAIVVQGLANNTLGFDTWYRKLAKEFSVATINGSICALLIFAYAIITEDIHLALTVSLSLITVIIFAALFGTFIPIILNRYKIDPALATGPFITTVNDVLGLAIYFLIGRLMYF